MASNLRVDTILPSTGTNVAIGTASGSVTFLGDTDITTNGDVTIGGKLGIGGTLTYEDVTNIDSVGVITARAGVNLTGGVINSAGNVNCTSGRFQRGSATVQDGDAIAGGININGLDMDASVIMSVFGNDGDFTRISGSKSRNASVGSHTIVQNNDVLLSLKGFGSDGTNFEEAAQIEMQVDGSPGNNVMPGRILFKTTATDGVVERLRITSSGALGTNATVRSANGGLDLCAQGATNLGTLTLGAGGGQNGQSRTGNQENQFRIMTPTYADPSKMFTVTYGSSGSGGHEINYGGGTGWAYATNQHRFYTASNQTTGTGTERMRISSEGYVTKPTQASFSANSASSYWTHGSSTGTLAIDNISTELFDIGGNYNHSTSVFTAPVAGKYFFSLTYAYVCTSGYLNIHLKKGVGGTYSTYGRFFVSPPQQSAHYTGPALVGIMDLAAGNTVRPIAELNYAGNQLVNLNFSGYLLG